MENKDTDYQILGLKCGLEIHQQLETHKLFCNCPSLIRDESPDKTVKRILRASAGETGTIDIAAQHEMEKQKQFVYEYYEDTNCLVELDEQPPNSVNPHALTAVLQLAKMTQTEIVDEMHVMRKTVVDGSNTSGFQRTALIARNGFIDVEGKNIKIETICLEEDAARIIQRGAGFDIYRLDRLGIPLIEIATGPDMHAPEDVKEVAAYIGMLLRSTGKVKRGLGTIRQDVNVSIRDGARVEIKGVQDLKMLDTVVKYEVLRQKHMLKLREEMQSRGVKIDNASTNASDMTPYFENSSSNMIKKNLTLGLKMYGNIYKNFKGFFGFEVNPNRRFGSELSDRIKVLGLNGLIHTDEDLNKYGLKDDISKIYMQLNLNPEDAMILIIGDEGKCEQAFARINAAIYDFIKNGLSKEVRTARDDGTSVFLRPMPGSSRMYPETDVPNIIPNGESIVMPELIKDKIVRFEKKYLIPRQVAQEAVFEEDFELFTKKYPQIKPITIAEVLVSILKDIKTRYNLDLRISREQLEQILEKLNSGDITKEAAFEIMVAIAQGETALDFSRFKTSEDEISSFIIQLIGQHPQLNAQALMGLVMKEYRGKFPGQKILELIKKFKEN
jgi:glutamyl-tRNA(Gln) amidotransferase subunit E